jgi:uncharacterized protein (DUF4213/DUF364 family)
VRDAGTLAGRSGLELAGLARSERLTEAAIGVAAINSLLETPSHPCVERNASEIIAEKGRGKNVVIVGKFPFISAIRAVTRQLLVLERRALEDTLPESEAEKIIPEADVVAISGSALINHSLDRLLGLCPSRAFVVVLGPSTPLSSVLFDHGVDVISGIHVVDIPKTLRSISEGAIFPQVQGVRLLTMHSRG